MFFFGSYNKYFSVKLIPHLSSIELCVFTLTLILFSHLALLLHPRSLQPFLMVNNKCSLQEKMWGGAPPAPAAWRPRFLSQHSLSPAQSQLVWPGGWGGGGGGVGGEPSEIFFQYEYILEWICGGDIRQKNQIVK